MSGTNTWRLAIAMALLLSGCARNERSSVDKYPERSVDLIVPWTPGGGSDRLARFVADALQRRLGQPVVVVNRTGGGGAVGHTAGALAAPDGYTLTLGTFELGTMRWMGISRVKCGDFAPVALLNVDAAALFVRHDAPWRDLPSLLEAIRREPGRLRMSGTASGGVWDLARSGLMLEAGISPAHVTWVPAPGSAPAMVELLGGHIDVVCCSVPEAWSQVDGGEIRALAVLSPERLAGFEAIPTAREQGLAFDAMTWRGVLAPASTPPELVARLGRELVTIADSEGYREFLRKNGFGAKVEGPEGFARFLEAEEPRWREVIQGAGYQTLGRNSDPGSALMPICLVVLLALGVLFEWLRVRRGRVGAPGKADFPRTAEQAAIAGLEGTVQEPGSRRDGALLIAALGVYVVVLPWVGFVASTLVFSLLVQWRLGARWGWALVTSGGLVATIHLLFVMLFKVPLP